MLESFLLVNMTFSKDMSLLSVKMTDIMPTILKIFDAKGEL